MSSWINRKTMLALAGAAVLFVGALLVLPGLGGNEQRNALGGLRSAPQPSSASIEVFLLTLCSGTTEEPEVFVSETSTTVSIRATRQTPCDPNDFSSIEARSATLQLDSPVGDRTILDDTTGQELAPPAQG